MYHAQHVTRDGRTRTIASNAQLHVLRNACERYMRTMYPRASRMIFRIVKDDVVIMQFTCSHDSD